MNWYQRVDVFGVPSTKSGVSSSVENGDRKESLRLKSTADGACLTFLYNSTIHVPMVFCRELLNGGLLPPIRGLSCE